jgi:adenylate cyclase
MSNVFVSYARSDGQIARRVAEALRALGHTVWRDDELPAHRAYADVIEERIKGADAVVVLWSADAAKSQWVRAEADAARSAGTLVQASSDGTIPPMPFNQINCAELKGWDGGKETPGWRKLVTSVSALAAVPDLNAERPARRRDISVCVLPFSNMSGDAEQEYFSDGISEDITTDLSKVSALGVTARNAAFMFKGQGADVCDIASKLGVSHILEGSVRKAGDRVRITAQLVDGTSGDHVWAERYDRELTDIFAIQDEISKAIVDALKVRLLPEERKAIEQRGTNSAEAYNLYLMARRYWISGNWGDTRQLELVIRICKRALQIDPNYARAWGLMAIVQSILHFTFNMSDDDGTAAAEKALALDPAIAEAYCVRARHQYELGKFDKADELLAQAIELDPDSWEVNREAARIFFFQRRFDEAIRHWERAVEIDDTDYHSWGMLCSAYQALGDEERLRHAADMALVHSERVIAHDPTNGAAHGIGAFGLAMRGERERLKDWIERALLISPDNVIMRYNFACTTALYMDDPKAALDLLESVFAEATQSAYKAIFSDPDMDSLREHPRFRRMMEGAAKRLGLAAPIPAAAAAAQPRS